MEGNQPKRSLLGSSAWTPFTNPSSNESSRLPPPPALPLSAPRSPHGEEDIGRDRPEALSPLIAALVAAALCPPERVTNARTCDHAVTGCEFEREGDGHHVPRGKREGASVRCRRRAEANTELHGLVDIQYGTEQPSLFRMLLYCVVVPITYIHS